MEILSDNASVLSWWFVQYWKDEIQASFPNELYLTKNRSTYLGSNLKNQQNQIKNQTKLPYDSLKTFNASNIYNVLPTNEETDKLANVLFLQVSLVAATSNRTCSLQIIG